MVRLITKGSIEEGILECAENKLKLEQDLNHIQGSVCVCVCVHSCVHVCECECECHQLCTVLS